MGFAAGTRLKTPEKILDIRDVKVGDLVMSRSPEGNIAYKRVTSVKAEPDQPICFLSKTELAHYPSFVAMYLTPDQLIWISGQGWVRANQVETVGFDQKRKKLTGQILFLDGAMGVICNRVGLYQTPKQNTAWVPISEHSQTGMIINFSSRGDSMIEEWNARQFDNEYWEEEKNLVFKTTVYGLDVEDWHTYFPGGVLANCL